MDKTRVRDIVVTAVLTSVVLYLVGLWVEAVEEFEKKQVQAIRHHVMVVVPRKKPVRSSWPNEDTRFGSPPCNRVERVCSCAPDCKRPERTSCSLCTYHEFLTCELCKDNPCDLVT